MINLVEVKDIEWFANRFEELKERTKRHTKQIQELQKLLKGGKEDDNKEM